VNKGLLIGQDIRLAQNSTQLSKLRQGQKILTLRGERTLATEPVASMVLHKNPVELVDLRFSQSVRLRCEARTNLYSQPNFQECPRLICLVDCEGLGLGLVELMGFPSFLQETPLFYGKHRGSAWAWQKFWILETEYGAKESYLSLQSLSLSYGLPILFPASFQGQSLGADLQRELLMLRPRDEAFHRLAADYPISNTPDFVSVNAFLYKADPIFGFYLLDDSLEQTRNPSKVYILRTLDDWQKSTDLKIESDHLLVFQQGFNSEKELKQFWYEKFKDQNSCLLPRIRKQSKLYSRTNAGRLFRGLKILGLKNQRVTDLTFLEKSNCAGEGETCVSLALNQQGTCFVQRVAVALEGAKE
jgi:hypothetical protein